MSAVSLQAGSVTYAGSATDLGAGWRSIKGLGSDGWYLFGGTTQSPVHLPAYVAAVTNAGTINAGNSSYAAIDDPGTTPGASPSTEVSGNTKLAVSSGTGNQLLTFTLTGTVPSRVRVGVLIDNQDKAANNASGIRLFQPGSSADSGFQSLASSSFNDLIPDWLYFDVVGGASGDRFVVEAFGGPKGVAAVGGLSFDGVGLSPTREYVRLGGRVVAIENAGFAVSLGASMSVSASTLNMAAGATASVPISVSVNGGVGAVVLKTSGLPTGATSSFDPPAVAGGGTSILSITLPTSASGSYSASVVGTAGPLSQSAPLTLNVSAIAPIVGYNYSRAIAIPQQSAALANFPLLIAGSFPYLATAANGGKVASANGYDIAFTSDAAGANRLAHQIDSYSVKGTAAFWVNVSLSSSGPTTIYMWYGNSSVAASQENALGVWANYQMVLHLNESVPPYLDSTKNGYASTGGIFPTAAPGKIGTAQSFDGISQYIAYTQSQSPNPNGAMTVETWVKTTQPGKSGLLGKFASDGTLPSDGSWGFQIAAGVVTAILRPTDGTPPIGVTDTTGVLPLINDGAWHLLAMTTVPTGDTRLYVDGKGYDRGNTHPLLATTGDRFLLGAVALAYGPDNFNGLLDETRISAAALTGPWIAAEFANQNSPSSFYTIGTETSGANAFAISASAPTLTLTQGSGGTDSIAVAYLTGFKGAVALTVSGCPAGVTCTLSPTSLSQSATSTLTITASASATVGTSTVTVTATSGTFVQSAKISLTISSPSASFTLGLSTPSLTIQAGASGPETVTISALNGFGGTVSFTTSGLPAGATASFNPVTLSGAGSDTLTIATLASATVGTSTVTVKATSGALVQTATFSLTISAASTFSLSLGSQSPSPIVVGSSGTVPVTVAGQNGFNSQVSFSVPTLATGLTAAFSPTTVTGSGSNSMTVSASVYAQTAAASPFTVNGTAAVSGSTETQSVSGTLNIQHPVLVLSNPQIPAGATTASFSITVTPPVPGDIFQVQLNLYDSSVSPAVSWCDVLYNVGTQSWTLAVTKNLFCHVQGVTSTLNASTNQLTVTFNLLQLDSTVFGGPLTVEFAAQNQGQGITFQSFGTFTVPPPPQPTFQLTGPGNTTASGSSSLALPIGIAALNGFTSSVSFAVSGLPQGITESSTPAPVTGGSGSTQLNLFVDASTVAGSYQITIAASSASPAITQTATFTLTVTNPSFSISLGNQTPSPILVGGSGSLPITVSGQNGFTSTVTFNGGLGGNPAGVSPTYSPNQVTGPGSAKLLITPDAQTPTGSSYPISVSASANIGGASQTEYAPGTLNILHNAPLVTGTVPNGSSAATFMETVTPPTVINDLHDAQIQLFDSNSVIWCQIYLHAGSGTFAVLASKNSFCADAGSSSSVDPNTQILTVVYRLSFAPGVFTGPLTVFYAASDVLQQINTQTAGTFAVPAPTFTVSGPGSSSAQVGTSPSYSVGISAQNGFASAVSLSASAPSGVSATFSPTSVTGSGTSTLTLSVGSSVAPGSYTIGITGASSSPAITQTASFTLTVTDYDFTISVGSQNPSTIQVGSVGTLPVTVAGLNGFSSQVSFAATGLPTGTTGAFSPTTVTGSGSTSLTLTPSATTPTGASTITVTGTGSIVGVNASRSATGAVNIQHPPLTVSATNPSSGTSASFRFTVTEPILNDIVLTQVELYDPSTLIVWCDAFFNPGSGTFTLNTSRSNFCTNQGSSYSFAGTTLTVNFNLSLNASVFSGPLVVLYAASSQTGGTHYVEVNGPTITP